MENSLVLSNNQEIIAELSHIGPPRVLSSRDQDIFLASLDADPEPTEAAKKAAT